MSDDLDQLRYTVELQAAPRSRTWTLVGLLASEADATYLANTYADHDAQRARVRDSEDATTIHDTKDRR